MQGPPSEIVEMAERGTVEVFASMELLQEITRVLRYDRIAERFAFRNLVKFRSSCRFLLLGLRPDSFRIGSASDHSLPNHGYVSALIP